MTKIEDSGSLGWSVAYFMRTIEDVAKAVVAVAPRSPRPSAVFSIKMTIANFRNFNASSQGLGVFDDSIIYVLHGHRSVKEPSRLFESMNSSSEARKGKVVGELKIKDYSESLSHGLSILPTFQAEFFQITPLHSHSSASTDFNVLSPNGFHHNVKNNHIDEFHLQDHLPFLDEGPKDPDLFFPSSDFATDTDAMFFNSPPPNWGVNNEQHRRSHSVTDIGSDPFGWKPCLYYARGYCKNGTSCRFLHDSTDSTTFGGEFDVMEQCRELLRSRSLKHCQHQQQIDQCLPDTCFWAAAGLMLDGDDLHHYGQSRIERSDFLSIPGGMANSASRQIYLTFPADSTFREEDVSNYFSIYYETVKLILAKGNPHFFCDARVLVKPYKEKGKVPDSYMHSTFQFHNFDLCFMRQIHLPPLPNKQEITTTNDGVGRFLTICPRMFYNTNELLMRRKLEQAELQQAMELHSRKLMGLHLFYGNKHHRRNLSTGTGSVPSPIHSHTYVNQNFTILTSSPGQSSPMTQLDNCAVSCATSLSLSTIADNVSKPQAELDHGDNDTEENSKHGDNNTHVRSDMDEEDMEEASTSGRESFNDYNILG
ncbi:hypothetical protein IFM89_030868 [Coptis chinensis]|uniref:C3H1-type domain-containing protein n=1 Tax=Coptis chinensis TaxID=261450 RepID=A0A835GYZ3_9MAGN|nr:hypothetical protein IFM89_030868 [Coptis chinensis]